MSNSKHLATLPKRPLPNEAVLDQRQDMLTGHRTLSLPEATGTIGDVGLEPGNTKTGRSGSLYRTIFVWNLPAVATCPGASS